MKCCRDFKARGTSKYSKFVRLVGDYLSFSRGMIPIWPDNFDVKMYIVTINHSNGPLTLHNCLNHEAKPFPRALSARAGAAFSRSAPISLLFG